MATKGNGAPPPKPPPKGITAAELLAADLPDIHPLCEPWFYEGVTIVAGPPKAGKTTFLRGLCEGVSTEDGAFLGNPCEHGRVCFLSLEEGPRLFRRKLQAMNIAPEVAAMWDVFFEWPQGLDGCDQLHDHIAHARDTRLVVIDVFAAFRQAVDKVTTQYQADYDAMSGLTVVTKQNAGLAVAASMHTRKMRSLDPMEEISGTFGLAGAADAFLVLRRQGAGGTLHAGGRLWDRDENDFELSRKDQRWHMVGASDGLTESERFALDVVTKAGGMTPSELARFLSCSAQNAQKRLKELYEKGKVDNRKGTYYPLNSSR